MLENKQNMMTVNVNGWPAHTIPPSFRHLLGQGSLQGHSGCYIIKNNGKNVLSCGRGLIFIEHILYATYYTNT